jgi:hypothetical protein
VSWESEYLKNPKWSYVVYAFLYFILIFWVGETIWAVMTAIGVVIWLFGKATKK